jgi:hypothetical protein
LRNLLQAEAQVYGRHVLPPYGSPELSSEIPADANIAEIKALLKRSGAEAMPLWNTELYYLKNDPPGATPQMRSRLEPKHAAWRFLVDLGEGVAQSATIHLPGQLFGNASFPDVAPHPAYVAYNALARYFEGATPIGKLKREDLKSVVYIYKRKEGPIAAAWDYADKANTLKVEADPAKFKLVDIVGNEAPFPVDGTPALKPEPVYILP